MRQNNGRDIGLNDALRDYYLAKKGSYAPDTWRAHERELEKMRAYLTGLYGHDALLSDVDERDFDRYFNRLRRLSASTFNNYRQYMKQFWDYCRNEAWVLSSPMRHVDPMPVRKKRMLKLTAHEIVRGMELAAPRDRFGIALGINTALRATDLANLRCGDVNLITNDMSALIKKTRDYDEFPITADLRQELILWFHHYAEVMGVEDWRKIPDDWTLLPPAHWYAWDVNNPKAGGRVAYKVHATYRHPEGIVHRMLRNLGYTETKGEGFHTLRRSAALMHYQNAKADGHGDPIVVAQGLLIHKDRKTTELYLGIERPREERNKALRGKPALSAALEREARELRESEGFGEGTIQSA